jgi:hypothetical protein
MEHAVPVTTDPYGDGLKVLKLYDVKFSQIPWASWKERFPPVELKDSPKTMQSIEFKQQKSDEPGAVLTKVYSVPWYSGLESRLWLSSQIDAGYFVSKLLLSESSSFGLLPTPPPVEIPTASFPEADPEICVNLTSNFDMFLSAGLYRPNIVKDKTMEGVKCMIIPVGTIQQEKRDSGFRFSAHGSWR